MYPNETQINYRLGILEEKENALIEQFDAIKKKFKIIRQEKFILIELQFLLKKEEIGD